VIEQSSFAHAAGVATADRGFLTWVITQSQLSTDALKSDVPEMHEHLPP
jgi:hypothetical protein